MKSSPAGTCDCCRALRAEMAELRGFVTSVLTREHPTDRRVVDAAEALMVLAAAMRRPAFETAQVVAKATAVPDLMAVIERGFVDHTSSKSVGKWLAKLAAAPTPDIRLERVQRGGMARWRVVVTPR